MSLGNALDNLGYREPREVHRGVETKFPSPRTRSSKEKNRSASRYVLDIGKASLERTEKGPIKTDGQVRSGCPTDTSDDKVMIQKWIVSIPVAQGVSNGYLAMDAIHLPFGNLRQPIKRNERDDTRSLPRLFPTYQLLLRVSTPSDKRSSTTSKISTKEAMQSSTILFGST